MATVEGLDEPPLLVDAQLERIRVRPAAVEQAVGELKDRYRENPDEITVADLTGVGVQDAAIAQAVVEALGL